LVRQSKTAHDASPKHQLTQWHSRAAKGASRVANKESEPPLWLHFVMALIGKIGNRVIFMIRYASVPTRFMTQAACLASPTTLLSRHHIHSKSTIRKAIKEGYHDTFIIDEHMPPRKKRSVSKYAEDDSAVKEDAPETKRTKATKTRNKATPATPDRTKLTDEEGNDYWEVRLPLFPSFGWWRRAANTLVAWRTTSPRHGE
jgi:hypothetical protein